MSNVQHNINTSQVTGLSAKLLYISRSVYEKDWHSTLHSHRFSEILFVTKGEGLFVTEREQLPIRENDMVVINPNLLHTEKNDKTDLFEYIILGVDDLFFQFDSEEETFSEYQVFHFQQYYTEFRFWFRRLLDEAEQNPKNFEQVCQNILELLLIDTMRYSSSTISIIPAGNISKECWQLKRYIDLHFKENLSLDDLANIVHINKFYLVHSFSRSYGTSPINYLIDKRIRESQLLLENTDFSLSQISQIVGFSSPSYFSQSFKRILKESPNQYRKKALSNQ
jgi:AraC-like DNA-binding protein/quercetin dioxygenase-like cupin family protein